MEIKFTTSDPKVVDSVKKMALNRGRTQVLGGEYLFLNCEIDADRFNQYRIYIEIFPVRENKQNIIETITDADYPAPPSELDHLRIRVGEMAEEIERLQAQTRITEQDARKIIYSFSDNCSNGDFNSWHERQGRTLLQKLNSEKNG